MENKADVSWDKFENIINVINSYKNLFDNIEMKKYKDNLRVTEAAPIIDYFFLMPKNVQQNFNKEGLYELAK